MCELQGVWAPRSHVLYIVFCVKGEVAMRELQVRFGRNVCTQIMYVLHV